MSEEPQQPLEVDPPPCDEDTISEAASPNNNPACRITSVFSPGEGQAWSSPSGRLISNFGPQDGGYDARSLHFMRTQSRQKAEDPALPAEVLAAQQLPAESSEDSAEQHIAARLSAAVASVELDAADRATYAEDGPAMAERSVAECCAEFAEDMSECYPRTAVIEPPVQTEAASNTGFLTRARSNIPCSTHIYESAIIPAAVDDVWEAIRSMDFAYNDQIEGGELVHGDSVNEVGAVHKIHFKDGSYWMVQIMELSDLNRRLTLDLIERSDGVQVSSCVHEICLKRVAQDNSTFVQYSVEFSNDADYQVCEDAKYKRKEDLINMQLYFELTGVDV
eukprot:TRINITY_DN15206_c0_g1_i2.p1 TRINITY_DN15206_c0_g1~~TRINITY_DN15206_c0_g1_i2.p1  ORF type:complete len:335 (-),score=81.00 TRINITY_DN15206_c0_g1_i2:225-1229(-)